MTESYLSGNDACKRWLDYQQEISQKRQSEKLERELEAISAFFGAMVLLYMAFQVCRFLMLGGFHG